MNRALLNKIIRKNKDVLNFYFLDLNKFEDNFLRLNSAFSTRYKNFKIAYSYKTNYIPNICKKVDELGGYAEVVSPMEIEIAKSLGVNKNKIVFNGPIKDESSVSEILNGQGLLNLNSFTDINLLISHAKKNPYEKFKASIRVNFKLDQKDTSRFGISSQEKTLNKALNQMNSVENINLTGIHCHFPNRDLKSFSKRTKKIIEIVDKFFSNKIETINIGGGFYGEMPSSLKKQFKDEIPTFEHYAEAITYPLNEYFKNEDKPMLLIEPGSSLVANTLSYCCKVLDIDTKWDKTYVNLFGSIYDISPTNKEIDLPLEVLHINKESKKVKGDLVGYTCIENDILNKDFSGELSIGDWICFKNVGSYSIVMKPPFINGCPAVFCKVGGELKLIRSASNHIDILQNFL